MRRIQTAAARRIATALLVFSLAVPLPAACADALPTTELVIGGHSLTVEIAADMDARSRGLMFRKHLPADQGMLFVWPNADRWGMWMKNTLIPLDVAFFDDDYVIVNIETMEPQTTRPHRAERAVRYALEVNAGWFDRHGLAPGDGIPELGRFVEAAAWKGRENEMTGSD